MFDIWWSFAIDLYSNVLFQIFDYFPARTRRPGDVPWRSPKGPNVRDLQRTFKGLLGNQQKNWWFDKKKYFLDAIVFVLRNYYCFLLEKQILVVYEDVHGINISCKWGRSPDVFETQLRDVSGTKWWDVLGTSAGRR